MSISTAPDSLGKFPSALCAEIDPELFFPEKGDSSKAAKKICNRCPEIEKCLEDALTQVKVWGIRGGTSERDRRVILKERNRENKGTPRILGINQINAPKAVRLRKQGLPNYLIAEALGINDVGVTRALAYAKRIGLAHE